MGRPISDITSSLKYEGFVADAEEVLRNLRTVEREIEVANGTWYMTRIAPYRTSEDRIAGVVATFIDITARRKTEAELRESEAELRESETKFRTLSDTAPALIWFNDEEGNNRYVNQRYLEFTGKTAREVADKRWQLIIHPEDQEGLAAKYEAARREQGPFHHMARIRRHDGEWRWIESFGQPLFDTKKRYLGHVGVSPDITDRKEAEEAMRASEERFRTVADNVPQLIWTNTADGSADYFNRRWYEYSGLSYEESVGPGWQAMVHPDDGPSSVARWQQALAKGEVFDCRVPICGARTANTAGSSDATFRCGRTARS